MINSDIANSRLGLYFGFTIGMTAIIAGTIIISFGQVAAGTIIGGAALIGLVGTFVYGSQRRSREREIKNKDD